MEKTKNIITISLQFEERDSQGDPLPI
jgi:hypothetical protein